ncbi:MAG: HDIG domain-containing protein [Chitinophagaceae bacterium]|nr:MAG: HDIG domain-containing protein [Chitinophagaceae bacterium]
MLNSRMQLFVQDLLKSLPAAYSYHNVNHTLSVQHQANAIAQQLGITGRDAALIDAAALWHDTGYLITYAGHEEASCGLARKHLPEFGFSQQEITAICSMIMATKLPQAPQNIGGEILADADLAYLGTTSAAATAETLFEELSAIKPGFTRQQWRTQQLDFISHHQYFTIPCQEKFEPLKQVYLAALRKNEG